MRAYLWHFECVRVCVCVMILVNWVSYEPVLILLIMMGFCVHFIQLIHFQFFVHLPYNNWTTVITIRRSFCLYTRWEYLPYTRWEYVHCSNMCWHDYSIPHRRESILPTCYLHSIDEMSLPIEFSTNSSFFPPNSTKLFDFLPPFFAIYEWIAFEIPKSTPTNDSLVMNAIS